MRGIDASHVTGVVASAHSRLQVRPVHPVQPVERPVIEFDAEPGTGGDQDRPSANSGTPGRITSSVLFHG